MIKISNMRELDRICDLRHWNMSFTIDEAELFIEENGFDNQNFVKDGISFICENPAEYKYDEDGEIIQEIKPAIYTVSDLY